MINLLLKFVNIQFEIKDFHPYRLSDMFSRFGLERFLRFAASYHVRVGRNVPFLLSNKIQQTASNVCDKGL